VYSLKSFKFSGAFGICRADDEEDDDEEDDEDEEEEGGLYWGKLAI
jgi:hypothetical protein